MASTPAPVPPAALLPTTDGSLSTPAEGAAYERGVAAGRTAAAADILKTHEAWARTGKLAQWYLDGVADAASIADPEGKTDAG